MGQGAAAEFAWNVALGTPRTAEASAGHGESKTQLFATYASFREQHLSEVIISARRSSKTFPLICLAVSL
jgi:hypothetical protein